MPMAAHYKPMLLANILSMKGVQSIPGIRITMDTLEESAILIHLSDGNVLNIRSVMVESTTTTWIKERIVIIIKLNLIFQLQIIIKTYRHNLLQQSNRTRAYSQKGT